MEAEAKLKKLEQLLKGKGWEEVAATAKTLRGNIVMEMINSPRGAEPQYWMDDILKERIKMINWFLALPKRLIAKTKDELPEGTTVDETGDDLDIGSDEDLPYNN